MLSASRSRAAYYPDEQIADLRDGVHSAFSEAAGFPGEQSATSQVGYRHRMQLLRNGSSSLGESHIQLAEVLFEERYGDVLSAQVRGVLRARDLRNGQ